MVEFLISVQVPNTHLRPIQISILYNEDGSVESIDWRESIEENEMEWSDQDSDEDPSYIPAIDTDSDEYSDYSDYSDY